jgi:hypothetical protein
MPSSILKLAVSAFVSATHFMNGNNYITAEIRMGADECLINA